MSIPELERSVYKIAFDAFAREFHTNDPREPRRERFSKAEHAAMRTILETFARRHPSRCGYCRDGRCELMDKTREMLSRKT